MSSFELRLRWEVEEGVPLDLVVSGTQGRTLPAIRDGHPDRRRPAEGGEIEIENATNSRGVPLPPPYLTALRRDDAFLARIEELLC